MKPRPNSRNCDAPGADAMKRFQRRFPALRRGAHDLALLEFEADAGDRRLARGCRTGSGRARGGAEARRGDDDHAGHRFLDRRDANHAGGQFDFAIDARPRRGHARLRRVAILAVERTVAHAERQVRARRRRDVDIAAAQRGNRGVLLLFERRVVDVERVRVDAIVGGGVRAFEAVDVARAAVPVKVDLTAAALVEPLREQRALIGRRVRVGSRGQPDIDVGVGELRREIGCRAVAQRFHLRARGFELRAQRRLQRAERVRVVAQQHAFARGRLQRGDDAGGERVVRDAVGGRDHHGQGDQQGQCGQFGGGGNHAAQHASSILASLFSRAACSLCHKTQAQIAELLGAQAFPQKKSSKRLIADSFWPLSARKCSMGVRGIVAITDEKFLATGPSDLS